MICKSTIVLFLFLVLLGIQLAGAGESASKPSDLAAQPKAPTTPLIFQTIKDYDPANMPEIDYSQAGKNRFRNASFEEVGEDAKPSGWLFAGETTMITNMVRSGQKALCLEKPEQCDGRVIQNVLNIQGGASYRAVVYMRSLKGSRNVNIKFEVQTAEGRSLGGFRSEHFIISDKDGWTRVEYAHKLPPLPNIRLRVLYRIWNAGPLLLDDASVSLIQAEPMYLSPQAKGTRLAQTTELLAWTVPLPTRILPNHPTDVARTRAWPSGKLKLRLAGNETGILPLFLSAGDSALTNLHVKIDASQAGEKDNNEFVLCTLEPFAYLGDLYYDVLVPMKPFTLQAGQSKMVWLSVYMPPGAERGATSGALLISAKGMEPVSIPFDVDTFAFDLPREPALPFSVGIPRLQRRIRPSERKVWLRDIARHRISIRFLYGPTMKFEGDNPIFDFTKFDAELDEVTQLGMGLFQLPYAYVITGHGSVYTKGYGPFGPGTISDEFRRKFVNTLRELGAHLEKKGVLDRFNANLFDEPFPEHYPQIRELVGLLRKANPRYRPSAYGVGAAAWGDGELAGYIEEPIGAGWTSQNRKALRKQGALVTVYNPFQNFDITRRPEYVRGFPWWAFRCDIDRVYHWCILPHGSMRQQDYGNTWVFYDPARDAYFSSVRWEMLREGMEDYDYVVLFRQAVENVAAKLGVKGIDSRQIVDFFVAQLTQEQIMAHSIVPEEYERMHDFLGSAIETFATRPLVMFHLTEIEEGAKIHVEIWMEPGAKAVLQGKKSMTLSKSGAVDLAPDGDGCIDLVVSKGGQEKHFKIPVR